MATAGEGTAYESVGGGGGVGGKFRKRPFRRPQTTPYDRPQMAVRSTNTKGWLSKLVDPASKLISASAHFFFSSLFRKRLPPPHPLPPPPPPPPAEANQEPRDRVQKAVSNNHPIVQGPVISDGCEPINSFDIGGLSELEQILNQKSFTRAETERLMELLHSRIVDIPNVAEDKWARANYSQFPSAVGRQDGFANNPMQDSRIVSHMEEQQNHESIATPVISSHVLEEDVAAPAEIAKAYMGSRPPKVSLSMLGLHSQALKEDANVPSNALFPSKSPVVSLVQKQTVRVGVPENGFVTPRSRGRSAIYNMARTPYHGPHPADAQKVLKRRSSILDDDVGPVRRLRQKTNLSTSRNLSVPVSGIGTGVDATAAADKHHISLVHKLHSFDEYKHRISRTVGEDEDKSVPVTSRTPVPSKSTEMATKILQQLEKLAPKDKSSEGKVVPLKEKPPSKLTLNMLRGQALRSLEDVDSSKILQITKDTYNLKDMSKTSLPDAHEPEVQRKVQENGSRRFVDLPDILAPASQGSSVPVTKTADSVSTVGTQPAQKKWAFQMSAHEEFLDLDDDIPFGEDASVPLAEGKKKIEMSVVETQILSSEAVTENETSTVAKVQSPDGHTLNESADLGVSDGTVDGEKMTVSTPSAPASSTTFQPVVANYPSTSSFDKIVPAEQSKAIPLFNSSPRNVDKIPPLTFSSSSLVTESPGLKFSASLEPRPESLNSLADVPCATDAPKVSESDGTDKNMPKFGDTSVTSVSSALSTSPPSGSIFTFGGPPGSSCLSNGSLDSKTPIFSSSVPVPASSSSPDQTLTNSFTSAALSTAFNDTTDAIIIATVSDSNPSSSASATSIPAVPIFKFDSDSVAPLNVMSAVSAISRSEATELKDKSEKETTFTSITSSTLGGSSSAVASTGSSIFGFNSSSSFANNTSQVSLFGTNNLVSTQMSPVETGAVASTQAMPIQFGSSSSSPKFGTSGTASFTSSSCELSSSISSISVFSSSTLSCSVFGSSNSSSSAFSTSALIGSVFTSSSSSSPVFGTSTSSSSVIGTSTSSSSAFGSSTSSSSIFSSFTSSSVFGSSMSSSSMFGSSTPKLFSSSASFGLSSTVSSPETNSIGSAGVTSSPFGSSWQPSKPSVFGSTFNTASPSTGFSFGAFSASASDTNSASMVFGSSTGVSSGSMFSFTSTVASASSQPQPVFGSSIPAFSAPAGNGEHMSMEDTMAEDPVLSSTPAIPVLGQSPLSAPGFMFGSTATASSGVPFQFGGIPTQNNQPSSSPFQASGSLDFTGSSSFSLGSGGADKANRKMVKVKHKGRRR